jgi:hypothetical protein
MNVVFASKGICSHVYALLDVRVCLVPRKGVKKVL